MASLHMKRGFKDVMILRVWQPKISEIFKKVKDFEKLL